MKSIKEVYEALVSGKELEHISSVRVHFNDKGVLINQYGYLACEYTFRDFHLWSVFEE